MPPVLNLDDAPPSPKGAPVPHPSLTHGVRPILTRQPPPLSEARRTRFRPSTPFRVSTQPVPEEKEIDFSLDEAKREEHVDEESRLAHEEYENRRRLRSYSEGSLMTIDDDEIISPSAFENNPTADVREASENVSYLFGYALPRFRSREISSYIVKCAPCFWCNNERRLSMTSRSIALRLQFLDAFFGLIQAASASFLLVVLTSEEIVDRNAQYVDSGSDSKTFDPNLWTINGYVLLAGIFGTIIFFLMIFSRRAIREVDLVGSLRSMWFMLWIVPLEVYVTIGMFDYHGATEVWIEQFWSTRSMAWFREWLCDPDTYNTLCVVPIDGLPDYSSEEEWCEQNYGSVACRGIRDAAQSTMARYAYAYYIINGVIGIVFIILLSLTVHVVEGIITKPIVQKSRESNIPLWLTLPIVGCLVTGALLLFAPSSALTDDNAALYSWLGVVYLISGGLYFFAALLGWYIKIFPILTAHDKRIKNLAILVFIGTLILTVLSVAFTFAVCISFSVVGIDDSMLALRGTLACSISPTTCSFCGNDTGISECPEWTESDVSTVLRTTLKQLATLAAIFMIYSIGALRFGFVLRHHLSLYQIDYV